MSNAWRSIKVFIASAGMVGSSIAIIYGSLQTGGTVYIIGGSLCMDNSVFNFIETGKVINDIKEQITNLTDNITLFSEENKSLKTNVDDLTNLKIDFVEKNRELQTTIHQTVDRINKLEDLRNDYVKVNHEMKENLNHEKEQVKMIGEKNLELTENLIKVDQIKEQIKKENNKLKELLFFAEEKITEIEQLKNDYVTENNKLSNNNQILSKQIQKQAEIITDSKKLIHNLAQFGDKYSQFASTIDTNLVKLDTTNESLSNNVSDLEDTASVLNKLVNSLKEQTFNQFDQNGDGKISPNEFNLGLNNIK